MFFDWIQRRRIGSLRRDNRVLQAADLISGAAPAPRRLVLVDLGYGRELWADYGETTAFLRRGRLIAEGKLVIEAGSPEVLATALDRPLTRNVVRF